MMVKVSELNSWSEYSAAVERSRKQSPSKIIAYFYGNEDPTTKKSWCPDCVLAAPVVKDGLKGASVDVEILKVAVGEREVWKSPSNIFRLKLKLSCIPTLLKLVEGKEVGRLEDMDCASPDKVSEFVRN